MLSGDEINSILEEKPNFIGCFARNELPQVSQPCSFIVNTDPSDRSGSHWLAIVLRQETALYFDSFGLPILEPDIKNYLSQYYSYVIYNTECIQDTLSEYCGYYCAAFIKQVQSVEDFSIFVNKFSFINPKLNDKIVMQMLQRK